MGDRWCKRPEQEATPPSERVGPRAKGTRAAQEPLLIDGFGAAFEPGELQRPRKLTALVLHCTAMPSIALQISGHLAGVCETEGDAASKLAALVAVVDDCRRAAKCDVYLHTWDRVHAPKKQAVGNEETGRVSDGSNSSLCVERVSAALKPMAVMVQHQPSNPSLLVPELGDAHWYRPARPGRNVTSDGRDWDTSRFPHAGTRAMIRGVALAASMRRAQELFLEAPYDLAVRLRPDVFRHDVPNPRRCMWPRMLRATQLERSVFGCSSMRPGRKNSDLCLWARPAELDRLVEAWEAFATPEIRRNGCYAELRYNASEQRQRCGLRAVPSVVRGDPSGTVQIPEELLLTAVVKAELHSRDAGRDILECSDAMPV